MRKLFHSLGMISLLALCGAAAGYAYAEENTFGGAIAPSHSNTTKQQEPPGYRGVIPGRVAPLPKPEAQADTNASAAAKPAPSERAPRERPPRRPVAAEAPVAKVPRMTMRPGFTSHKELTAEDLKQIAAMTGVEVRLDQISSNLANAVHMPPHVYPLVSLPQQRVDGMLPMEINAKQMIDKSMQDIRAASNISPEARKKAIEQSISNLSNFARGARIERDMPADIYDVMGAPPVYVAESREGASKAADRLQEALKTLKTMQ